MPVSGPGRLLALDAPPGDAFRDALESAWAAGDAVLPLDPQAPPDTVEAIRAAMQFDEPVPAGTAVVIATSGSTGEPKGVVLSHDALAASTRATVARIDATADDCWLSCLPWHHVAGLQVMLRARLTGAGLVVHERFDVDRVAADDRASLVSLVPVQLARLLDAGVDLTRFRAVLLGGAAASPALLQRAREAKVAVVTTYGMSETCGGCVYDGVPLDGVQVRVDADRRVWLRGPMLFTHYRGRPDLTAEALVDGWLRTSDLGEWDGRRLTVTGRADDIVVTGGANVSPAAVAAVLADHPALRDVVVTGVADAQWGQRVVAVAVAAAPVTLAELREWSRPRLEPAALPRGLVLVDRIPMLASGKPDLRSVRELAQSGSESASAGDRPDG